MRIYRPGLFICAIAIFLLGSYDFAFDQKEAQTLSEAEIISMINKAE
jgi:hypothetical protein